MKDGTMQQLLKAKNLLESGEEAKWRASEIMWKANKEVGISLREIGEVVVLSKDSVSYHIKIWSEYGLSTAADKRPSFTDAYYAIRNESPGKRETRALERIARERPEEIAKAVAENRAVVEAIVNNPNANLRVTAEQIKQQPDKYIIRGINNADKHQKEGQNGDILDRIDAVAIKVQGLALKTVLIWKDEASLLDDEMREKATDEIRVMIESFVNTIMKVVTPEISDYLPPEIEEVK